MVDLRAAGDPGHSVSQQRVFGEGTQRPSVPITLSDRDWSAPVRTLPSFGTVAGAPLLCQEAGRIAWMSAVRI
jgi:hypothetical protein